MKVIGAASSVLALVTGVAMFLTPTGSAAWWVLLALLGGFVFATIGCFGGFNRSAWVEDSKDSPPRPWRMPPGSTRP